MSQALIRQLVPLSLVQWFGCFLRLQEELWISNGVDGAGGFVTYPSRLRFDIEKTEGL